MAQTVARLEPLLQQAEDDVAVILRAVGFEAERGRRKLDEYLQQIGRVQAASAAMATLSAAAEGVCASLSETVERTADTNDTIRLNATSLEIAFAEARRLSADIGGQFARMRQTQRRLEVAGDGIGELARRANVTALNAGIKAERTSETHGEFAAIARDLSGWADRAMRASADIAAQIAQLHEELDRSAEGLVGFASLLRERDPHLEILQSALAAQSRDCRQSEVGAAQSLHAVRAIASKAFEIQRWADAADAASQDARVAGDEVVATLETHAHRPIVHLRSSREGDRRAAKRTPARVPAALFVRGLKLAGAVLDISEHGALLHLDKDVVATGERTRLAIDGVGECLGAIVAVSDIGVHYRFDAIADDVLKRLRKLIANVRLSDAPFADFARRGADGISRAFSSDVESAEVSAEDLITTNYRAMPGANPLQFATSATNYYDRSLPLLLLEYWNLTPAPLFAVAVDRNGYLPIRHPSYDAIDHRGWGELNAGDRRFLASPQLQAVSTNLDPEYVRALVRTRANREAAAAKLFAAPIFVGRRHWGNFLIGFHY